MEERIPCRILTGPTASGKSDFGLRIAEKHGWVIACMDSMQIYRGLNIGTAKPSEADRRRVKHYLLDICAPWESFSVNEYRNRAESLIKSLWLEERKEVLFVGGTGLYLQALTHPMDMGSVAADPDRRRCLQKIAEEPDGKYRLHEMLCRLDPKSAARLPVNDIRRIIRAIEVTEKTGIPFSDQPEREAPQCFEWRIASTCLDREILYKRINSRVDRMIRSGLAGEIRSLLETDGVSEEAQCMSGIGYKEMIPYVRGECTLDEAADRIRLNTRHYAKRQMTFLKREEQIRYVDVTDPDAELKLDIILQ